MAPPSDVGAKEENTRV